MYNQLVLAVTSVKYSGEAKDYPVIDYEEFKKIL